MSEAEKIAKQFLSTPASVIKSKASETKTVYIAHRTQLDCFAQGDTPEQAVRNLVGVTLDHIEHCLAHGLPYQNLRVRIVADAEDAFVITWARDVDGVTIRAGEVYPVVRSYPTFYVISVDGKWVHVSKTECELGDE
jgi:predicted RNase H-like HicB family nuclease